MTVEALQRELHASLKGTIKAVSLAHFPGELYQTATVTSETNADDREYLKLADEARRLDTNMMGFKPFSNRSRLGSSVEEVTSRRTRRNS